VANGKERLLSKFNYSHGATGIEGWCHCYSQPHLKATSI
jgi:hypothetical protein